MRVARYRNAAASHRSKLVLGKGVETIHDPAWERKPQKAAGSGFLPAFPVWGPFTVSPGGPPGRALLEDRKLGKWE